MTRRGRPLIVARRLPDGDPVSLNGREALTMLALRLKGVDGLRAYDFPGGPPFRLAAYVCDLRKLGFPIRTEREEHPGGTHAVYFLECAVGISDVADVAG